MEWKCNANNVQIVAGGNGKRNKSEWMNCQTDVIVDKKTDSLIICDQENRRICYDLVQTALLDR